MSSNPDRDFIISIGAQVDALSAQIDAYLAGAPQPPDGDESPTGRNPRLVWTRAQQAIFNRMRTESEAGDDTLGAIWYRLILDNARGDRYGDSGLWATLAYQITGDVQWVDQAWRKIEAMLSSALDDDNNTRELSAERVLLLDWLWPGLTPERRDEMFVALDRMFTNACDPAVRTTDSDQTTGVYMGVAWYHCAFGDVHPQASEFFARAGVGGLDATARDRTTLRNAIRDYVEMAAGGEWIESSEYNLGTVRLLVLGAAGVQTATGVDHFPEVTAWRASGATRYAHMLAPGLRGSNQWGDEQHPHQLLAWMWTCTAMCFDDPTARAVVADLVTLYGATGSYSAEPTVPRAFLQFNPYGACDQPATRLLDARGQGIVSARTSWEDDASLLFVHLPPVAPCGTVDHAVKYFGDLQLFRGERQVLTHPITYSGVGNDGQGINSMLTRGLGTPLQWRGANAVYAGDDWLYVAATSGGTVLASKFYQPPPVFWHEWSRAVLWVHGDDVDTLIVFDRSHADDPLQLPNCAKYPDDIEKKMKNNPLRQWRWHTPIPATIAGQSAMWPIDDEQARVTWLRDDLAPTIVNQTEAWANINMPASEKRFHLQLNAPEDCDAFETLITVLEFGNPGAFATTIEQHIDSDQQAIAVTLARADRPDWAVLFNTTPGPKLPNCDSSGAYPPQAADVLATVRLREFAPPPSAGARLWNMESASGVLVREP